MPEDIFDDATIRRAVEESLGLRARAWNPASTQWYFERRRWGILRGVEASPLGLYAPLCRDGAQVAEFGRFIDQARRPLLADVTIHLNPLEAHADAVVAQAAASGYQVVRRETHLLPIGGSIDDLRSGYHATKRYQALRKVDTRSRIVVADDPAQLEDYFAAYAASLARWGRDRPVHPRALFVRLLASPAVRFWMNYVEDRLACAMVVLYCRSYALYWQGVSDIAADQKHAYPMVKLMDAVIEHLVAQRIAHFNLGASEGLPNVRRFKEEFGARPRAYSSLTYRSPAWRALLRWRRAVGARPAPGAVVHNDMGSSLDGQRRLG